MFNDYLYEPLGTRQKRWLDYLWYHNDLEVFKVCSEYEPKKFGKWETIQECVCPVDHRELIKGEQVIEIDSDNRPQNIRIIRTIKEFLKHRRCQAYMTDHNGRSPHLHVFYMDAKLQEDLKEVLAKHFKLDRIKFNGVGLCRCEGGRYQKCGFYYSSYFEDVIKPITNKQEVRFPCTVKLN